MSQWDKLIQRILHFQKMSVLRIYVKYCCIMVMLNLHQEMAVVITHFERIGTIRSRCRNMGV